MTHALLTLYRPDGTRLAAKELAFDPYEARQWNDVFEQLGVPPEEEASAILVVLDGGSLTASAIQINNVTNDASFIPGQLLP